MPDFVNSMIAELKDLTDVIYDIKPPMDNKMLITPYLHAMVDGDFNWLWNVIISILSS